MTKMKSRMKKAHKELLFLAWGLLYRSKTPLLSFGVDIVR